MPPQPTVLDSRRRRLSGHPLERLLPGAKWSGQVLLPAPSREAVSRKLVALLAEEDGQKAGVDAGPAN